MEEEMVHCPLKGHKMRSSSPPNGAKCDACARSSLEPGEASYYSCSECNITIHRKCAQMPKQIDHPMHPEHPLHLLAKPPKYEFGTCQCQVCKEACTNFVYNCSSCRFDIDVVCAFLEDGKDTAIAIPTHHHPVRLIRRPATFRCNACKREENDNESYVCTEPSCGFWIHKKCGSLPQLFKRPDDDHPLELAIRMPNRYLKYRNYCEVCLEYFEPSVWIYYCQLCKYFCHIHCIGLPAPKHFLSTGRFIMYRCCNSEIRDEDTTVPHYYGVENAHLHYLKKQLEDRQLAEVMVDSHTHSLLLNSYHGDGNRELICDGCIQLIDSPYYKCGQSCNFFLHACCANLPQHHQYIHMHHGEDDASMEMKLCFPKNPWEAFKCMACHSLCNGYGYKCCKNDCNFYLDIKCCFLNGFLKHAGHKHEVKAKFIWSLRNYIDLNALCCTSCGILITAHLYCDTCGFAIGYECAMLPETVTHRWDKHPLILTFPPYFHSNPNVGEEFYCEACEEEIYPKHWIYRCADCDQSFHPRCLPTLGECRNIKFGKTFSIHDHPHPLTLVPQARLTSKCHDCRKLLNWSRAFECAPCGFYLCPDCIPKQQLVTE